MMEMISCVSLPFALVSGFLKGGEKDKLFWLFEFLEADTLLDFVTKGDRLDLLQGKRMKVGEFLSFGYFWHFGQLQDRDKERFICQTLESHQEEKEDRP